jgi:4-hydroxybenzoate polyprenyltransferase
VIRDLLLLARAPLAAGAVCNMLVGLLVAWPADQPVTGGLVAAVCLLALATTAMYWAGMVLNDWFDRDRDAGLHPNRPLPSGRVKAEAAFFGGVALILLGVSAASLASVCAGGSLIRGFLGGAAVAVSVLAYDGLLKRFRALGSLAMSGCRVTNVLLGPAALGFAFSPDLFVYTALVGLYIYSLTFLSTFEDEDAGAVALVGGFVGGLSCAAVILGLALWPSGPWSVLCAPIALALGLVLLLQFTQAIVRGTRARGEATTRAWLKAIWLLDLAVLVALGLWLGVGLLALLYATGTAGAGWLFAPAPATAGGEG